MPTMCQTIENIICEASALKEFLFLEGNGKAKNKNIHVNYIHIYVY